MKENALNTENTQNLPHEEYLTKVELSKRLHKTPRTIEVWAKSGVIPHLKIGRSVLYHWPTVQTHLNAHYAIRGTGKSTE